MTDAILNFIRANQGCQSVEVQNAIDSEWHPVDVYDRITSLIKSGRYWA